MNLSIDIMAKFMPYFLTLRNGILKLTTLPRGGSDGCQVVPVPCGKCISIHAPRGGSDILLLRLLIFPKISIHAPRVGSDSKDTQILLCIFGEEVEYLLFCGRDAGASMEGKR